jgi:lipoprotein-anchoring transpeptidase ErfK/SrfK
MKSFIIAMLLAGALLFAAALLWPDQSPPVAARTQRLQAIALPVEPREMQSGQDRYNPPKVSPQPATPRMSGQSTTAVSRGEPASDASSLNMTSGKSSLDPTSNQPAELNLTADEELTIKQTGTDDTSLRNTDFPRTYISQIHVDLTGPNQWVTLTWSGPQAKLQPATKYHSSPGRGLGNNDCDEPAESCRVDSNCTPKGTMHVQAFSNSMQGSPEVRFVTWFDTKRGIALHYYPNVPYYPASHGCVRLDEYAARLIHNNSKIGETEVVIDGTWKFVR